MFVLWSVLDRGFSRFKIWNKGSCLLYLIFYKKGWIINVSRQGFTLLQIWIYRNNFKNESRLILNLFHHLGVNLIFFVFLAKKFKWKRRELILLYFFLNERDDSRIGRKKRLKTTNWRRLKSLVTKLSVELKRAYAWKFFFTLRPEFFRTVLRTSDLFRPSKLSVDLFWPTDACIRLRVNSTALIPHRWEKSQKY